MNLIVDKNELSNALLSVSKAIPSKSQQPILENALIEAKGNILKLTGNNLDICIRASINANIKEEGLALCKGKKLFNIIKKLPEKTVQITHKNNKLVIKSGKAKFSLATEDALNYPQPPEVEEDKLQLMDAKKFSDMVKKTIIACAKDDTRPILTGVLLEMKDNILHMAALDGFRLTLSKTKLKNTNNFKVIIPQKNLEDITKICKNFDAIEFTFSDKYGVFIIGNIKIVTRLLHGEFIDYNKIIGNKFTTKVIINKNELLEALDRASIVSKDTRSNLIDLSFKGDNLCIKSKSTTDEIEEFVKMYCEGNDLEIAFNYEFLHPPMKLIDTENIEINLSGETSPCIITSDNNKDEYLYLVLPIRRK